MDFSLQDRKELKAIKDEVDKKGLYFTQRIRELDPSQYGVLRKEYIDLARFNKELSNILEKVCKGNQSREEFTERTKRYGYHVNHFLSESVKRVRKADPRNNL